MTPSELQQAMQDKKVEFVKPEEEKEPQTQTNFDPADFTSFLPLFYALQFPLKHLTDEPTFVPKNFLEQMQFFDDGAEKRLYLYINKAWAYVVLT